MEIEDGVKQEATVETSSPEVQDGNQAPQTEPEENLPFGKHPRWVKMQGELKDLRAQHETLAKEREEYAKAIDFHKALSGDPAKLQKVMEILSTQEEPVKEPESPAVSYDDFDPIVADKFKQIDVVAQKVDELLNKIAQQEQQTQESRLEESKARIDRNFDGWMTADGFMDKEGNGDAKVIEAMENLTLMNLAQLSQNPYFATDEEVKKAYDHAKEIMSATGKHVSKSNIVAPPPSGSSAGKPPSQRGTTEADRIARLMESV